MTSPFSPAADSNRIDSDAYRAGFADALEMLIDHVQARYDEHPDRGEVNDYLLTLLKNFPLRRVPSETLTTTEHAEMLLRGLAMFDAYLEDDLEAMNLMRLGVSAEEIERSLLSTVHLVSQLAWHAAGRPERTPIEVAREQATATLARSLSEKDQEIDPEDD